MTVQITAISTRHLGIAGSSTGRIRSWKTLMAMTYTQSSPYQLPIKSPSGDLANKAAWRKLRAFPRDAEQVAGLEAKRGCHDAVPLSSSSTDAAEDAVGDGLVNASPLPIAVEVIGPTPGTVMSRKRDGACGHEPLMFAETAARSTMRANPGVQTSTV